ncbi:MAG TPA: GNAT family N-acetyltransferase [Kofleriaceae bacterium]
MTCPDLPRWVEANGIASDPASWRAAVGDGIAVGHDAARLIVIVGDADPDAITALADARGEHAMLVAIERPELAAATKRVHERAILHTLTDPGALPDGDGAAPLDELPNGLDEPLASELAWAHSRGPIWAAWVDGAPASFAYAPWRSAAWFDVSVDTLPAARQLGLGTIVAAALIRAERARGRDPVWGANESNAASLALARHLGFQPIDELWVCAPRS